MPTLYSARALFGRAYLFRKFNDIEIYIEDVANRAILETLVRRLLDGHAKVTNIHQLGGRQAVIERCGLDQVDTRRRLYIIDGDLDLLTGSATPSLKHLYRLNVYCAENLLLCANGLAVVCYEDSHNEPISAISAKLQVETVYRQIERFILPLFIYYAIAHLHNCGIETVGFSMFKLLAADGGSFDRKKVSRRFSQVRRQAGDAVAGPDIRRTRSEIIARLQTYPHPRHHVISAKDFTLRYIFERCKKDFSTKSTFEQFKARIAAHCELDVDPGLRKALLAT